LNSESDRSWHLRWLSPSDLDILSADRELLQDGIGMEVRSRASVQEGNESTVLVWQKSDRLNLTTAHVSENLFGRRLRRNVSQVNGPAGTRNKTRGHLYRGRGLD